MDDHQKRRLSRQRLIELRNGIANAGWNVTRLQDVGLFCVFNSYPVRISDPDDYVVGGLSEGRLNQPEWVYDREIEGSRFIVEGWGMIGVDDPSLTDSQRRYLTYDTHLVPSYLTNARDAFSWKLAVCGPQKFLHIEEREIEGDLMSSFHATINVAGETVASGDSPIIAAAIVLAMLDDLICNGSALPWIEVVD